MIITMYRIFIALFPRSKAALSALYTRTHLFRVSIRFIFIQEHADITHTHGGQNVSTLSKPPMVSTLRERCAETEI